MYLLSLSNPDCVRVCTKKLFAHWQIWLRVSGDINCKQLPFRVAKRRLVARPPPRQQIIFKCVLQTKDPCLFPLTLWEKLSSILHSRRNATTSFVAFPFALFENRYGTTLRVTHTTNPFPPILFSPPCDGSGDKTSS